MPSVYVLGSVNMDLAFSLSRLPRRGETIQSDKFLMSPGGKGANQAAACAKQGVKTYMLGSVGDDPLSQALKSALLSNGIDCGHLKELKGEICGVAGILLEGGDNRIIIEGGANKHHDMDALRKTFNEYAAKGDYLVCQLEIPTDVVEKAFKSAKELGLTTVLNTAPAKELPDTLFPLVDLLVLNEIETETLIGVRPDSKANRQNAAKALMDKGAGAVLFTLGKQGSVYYDAQGHLYSGAYAVQALDTTAAGDAYIGVLIASLANGQTMQEAMRVASAAAAITVQTFGALEAIPFKQDIDDFLKRYAKQKKENGE